MHCCCPYCHYWHHHHHWDWPPPYPYPPPSYPRRYPAAPGEEDIRRLEEERDQLAQRLQRLEKELEELRRGTRLA
ncbi:hypothetical protein Nhal_1894 [Nitrosococcus halophilus Nc 4]|uniref:Uncharacterized protein n=1 Tax=Nitrosococcus halophilus (strain Nc4) TaxID=472759 RepID=D5C3N5_NITHN|nr:hypothetical protein [Nitrosococcus halophilus]ADE15007.1 hypothetical protein Nhal_1894 [Nitrosococcus halophilus Nc 4]